MRTKSRPVFAQVTHDRIHSLVDVRTQQKELQIKRRELEIEITEQLIEAGAVEYFTVNWRKLFREA